MKFPFEVSEDQVLSAPESYVDAAFSSLASEFLVMPKGDGFLDYPAFSSGYEALKYISDGFTRFDPDALLNASLEKPVIIIVLRAILGFTPPEWAYIAANRKAPILIEIFLTNPPIKQRSRLEADSCFSENTPENTPSRGIARIEEEGGNPNL